MITRHTLPLVIVSILFVVLPALGQIEPALEQVGTMVDLIKGKLVPLTVRVKDMDQQWLKLTISPRLGGANNMLTMMMNNDKMGATDTPCFTRGQVLTLDGVSYLATYSLPQYMLPALDDEEQFPQLVTLTAESTLTLSLLNMRTVSNLLDIRPFNLEQELRQGQLLLQAIEEQKRKALLAASISNLRQLATAVQMFMQDNDGKLPPMKDYEAFKEAIVDYFGGADQLFIHPITGKPYQINATLDGLTEAQIQNPTTTVLIFDSEPEPDGQRCVAFMDGHAKRVAEAQWAEMKKGAGIK